jgi:hypothetical protein
MLAGYTPFPGVAQVEDRYFDTADGRLLAVPAGCVEGDTLIGRSRGSAACRVQCIAALKRSTPPGVVARSQRMAAQRSRRWRRSGCRRAVEPLFGLNRRAPCRRFDGERRVAQLSLDHVRLDLTGVQRSAESTYYELEVELVSAGTEADLASIAADLSTAWRLIPEPRSKFERALAIVRERNSGWPFSPKNGGSKLTHHSGCHEHAPRWADGLGPPSSSADLRGRRGRAKVQRLGILAGAPKANAARAAPPGVSQITETIDVNRLRKLRRRGERLPGHS